MTTRTISTSQFEELMTKTIYFDSICLAIGVTHPQDVLSAVKELYACCPAAVSRVAWPTGALPPSSGRAFSAAEIRAMVGDGVDWSKFPDSVTSVQVSERSCDCCLTYPCSCFDDPLHECCDSITGDEEPLTAETTARILDSLDACQELGCPVCGAFPCTCNSCEDDGAEVLRPYHQAAEQIANLVSEKQRAYGDSFGQSGQVMRILYPNGISLEQMDDALTVVRVLDKLFRVATDRDALGESPWRDIAGYSLLSVVRGEHVQ